MTMIKSMTFVAGTIAGFVACSAMTEEQRTQVKDRVRSAATGPRTRRLKDAAHDVTSTVADKAVDATTSVADRVVHAVDEAKGTGAKVSDTRLDEVKAESGKHESGKNGSSQMSA